MVLCKPLKKRTTPLRKMMKRLHRLVVAGAEDGDLVLGVRELPGLQGLLEAPEPGPPQLLPAVEGER